LTFGGDLLLLSEFSGHKRSPPSSQIILSALHQAAFRLKGSPGSAVLFLLGAVLTLQVQPRMSSSKIPTSRNLND